MKDYPETKLSENAVEVLRERYLLKDEQGKVLESPDELFARVAETVAKIDALYDSGANLAALTERFYEMMAGLDFLPNSPTLMNAGTELGQLSACFVLPVEDSMESIFAAVKNMALIHKSGGGTGFSFSKIRPKGDVVSKTHGLASGPLSFMRVFDVTTEVVKQGGRRRGASMGILAVDHPDIFDFIRAKADGESLSNFNLSVAVTDEFMEAVKRGGDFALINPRNKKTVKRISAKSLFDMMVSSAHSSGDPGLVFIDEINNRHNPTLRIGEIEGTNPCGEQPLLPYESCNLGSINLAQMVRGASVDWEKLARTIRLAVHFLDNVIDASKFPLPEVDAITKANRKIGLGVMGFADMLIMLATPYDSEEAIKIGEEIMAFISKEAREKSALLAKARGSFPNFKESRWIDMGFSHMRNATTTTIAPTGTISIIANTSSGIEPLFAVSFVRKVMDGTRLAEVNPLFERMAKEMGLWQDEIKQEVMNSGRLRSLRGIPDSFKRLFETALEIPFEQHIKIQAAFQRHTDNAVSKTVNLAEDATEQDVAAVFMLAHEMRCKGVTVYRYGCKKSQVLYAGYPELKKARAASIEDAKNKSCPECKA
ncbi:MAG: adenosylcobalamin-dependent ribonucleoside-diphosphate reductase [Actinomycetota bacterium]|nr:adenosylcobalamin-dependent ribonucleoside-diphosphate reductase [Actinomycetota bacterium]